jgi:hypothetical protein
MSKITKEKILMLYNLVKKEFIIPFGFTFLGIIFSLYILSLIDNDFLFPKYLLMIGFVFIYITISFYITKNQNSLIYRLIYKNKFLARLELFANNDKCKKKVIFLCLSYLLILSSLVIFYTSNSVTNRSYWVDEAITVMVGRNISETGIPKIDGGDLYTAYPLHTFLLGVTYKIFGVNHITSRVPSLVFFMLTIFLIYYYFRKKSLTLFLIGANLYTFSLWNLGWATQARHYTFFALLYLLFFIFFSELYKQFTRRRLYLATISLILLSLVSGASLLLVIFSILFLLVIDQIKNIKEITYKLYLNRKKYYKYSPLVLGVLALLIVYQYPTLIRFPEFLKVTNNFTYYYDYFVRLHPILFWFFCIGILCYFISRNVSSVDKKIALSFVFVPFLVLSFANIYPSQPYDRYVYFLYPFFIIFSSIGVYSLSKLVFRSFLKSPLFKIFVFILSMFITVFILNNDRGFDFKPHKEYMFSVFEAPFPNYNLAFSFIKNDVNKEDIIVTTRSVIARVYLRQLDYILEPEINSPNYFKIRPQMMIKENTRNEDPYGTGSHIFGAMELDQIISDNKSGYLIWDWDLGDNLDKETMDYINSRLSLVYIPELNDKMIRVYSWGK